MTKEQLQTPKEQIADLTQEISDMQEDLVYDNITITNAAKDQLTIAEAESSSRRSY